MSMFMCLTIVYVSIALLQIQNSPNPKYPNPQLPKSPNPQIPKSPNPQINNSPSPKLHNSTDPQIQKYCACTCCPPTRTTTHAAQPSGSTHQHCKQQHSKPDTWRAQVTNQLVCFRGHNLRKAPGGTAFRWEGGARNTKALRNFAQYMSRHEHMFRCCGPRPRYRCGHSGHEG